ncbi:MLP-like protein 34 isoform X3 [Chenopodium quinoa]|uniref:MLP-like protein 34 isoform X3 n=1 Tax=Chenopodium quinoa TaxID=63459 RepID=UPI000B7733EB|nr:MLP-like protein 34 isoform X3 [Chenopodium quinoa]
MGLKRKLEGEVEIRESAADVLHDLYKNRPHHIAHSGGSNFIQNCDLHNGVVAKPGAIFSWTYTLDGKQRTGKTEIEEIDEEKKLVRYELIEGDLFDEYKSMSFICHVTPKDQGSCTLKWIIEYEKVHPGIPEPSSMLDALLSAAKDMDDHHHPNK